MATILRYNTNMSSPAYNLRRTKIVCTIGPASGSTAMIQRLIRSGMDVARLNLSHGNLEEHARYIQTVRTQSKRVKINAAILVDLPGPKYRIGRLGGGQVSLKRGSLIHLTIEDIEGNASLLPVTLPICYRI